MARSRYDGHPERMPMDGHGVLGLCAPRAWYAVAAIPPPPPPLRGAVGWSLPLALPYATSVVWWRSHFI
jgi:hypothetical protein